MSRIARSLVIIFQLARKLWVLPASGVITSCIGKIYFRLGCTYFSEGSQSGNGSMLTIGWYCRTLTLASSTATESFVAVIVVVVVVVVIVVTPSSVGGERRKGLFVFSSEERASPCLLLRSSFWRRSSGCLLLLRGSLEMLSQIVPGTSGVLEMLIELVRHQ